MLAHFLNPLLRARNGTEIVALRWMPLIQIPIGYKMLTFLIVEAWCVQQPAGELTGDYANAFSAFAAAWKIKP
jgi:hypothetical protein